MAVDRIIGYTNYPQAVDSKDRGGNVPGLMNGLTFFTPRGTLAANIGYAQAEIPVDDIDLSDIPVNGLVRIDDEIIGYSGVKNNMLLVPDPQHRGMFKTVAAAHELRSDVLWLITEAHFSWMADAIIALEKLVGTVPEGENPPDTALLDKLYTMSTSDLYNVCMQEIQLRQEHIDQKTLRMLYHPDPQMTRATYIHLRQNYPLLADVDFYYDTHDPNRLRWDGYPMEDIVKKGDRVYIYYMRSPYDGQPVPVITPDVPWDI